MKNRAAHSCLFLAFFLTTTWGYLNDPPDLSTVQMGFVGASPLAAISPLLIGIIIGSSLAVIIGILISRNKKPSFSESRVELNFDYKSKQTQEEDSSVQQGKLLLSQINKLEYLRMLESNSVRPDYVNGKAVDFILEVHKSFKSISNILDVDFTITNKASNVNMDYDKNLLTITLGNLFSQAFENIDQPYWVSSLLEIRQNKLVLTITKHGSVVDVEELDKLMRAKENLSEQNPTNCQTRLKTTYMLVELMNGSISISNAESGGIVHTIELPITQKAPKDSEAQLLNAEEHWKRYLKIINQYHPDGETQDPIDRLLIMETDVNTAAFIAFCVGERVSIQYTSNGKEGLAEAKRTTPTLIICNTVLHGKNGYNVCEELKKSEETKGVPIIMLSSESTIDDKLRGLGLGVEAYLEKPLNYKELVVRIQQLLIKQRESEQQKADDETPTIDYPWDLNDPDFMENDFIQRAKAIIDENMFDPQFGLDLFATKLNISQSQLRRKLFALTGLTPVRFIRQYRLAKAIDLLKNSDLNISQVAYETGFSDPKYFSRVFTKEIGVSPSEFRQKIQPNPLLL